MPRPFRIFAAPDGVAVRIATQRPFFTAAEICVTAAPVFLQLVDGAIELRGEGVVRRDRNTIRVTA